MADHAVPVRAPEPAPVDAAPTPARPLTVGDSTRTRGAWLPVLVAAAGVVTGLVLRAFGVALPLTPGGGR